MNDLQGLLSNLDDWGASLDRANLRTLNRNLINQVTLEELKTTKLRRSIEYLSQNKKKLEKVLGSQLESQEEELRTIENEKHTNANTLNFKNDSLLQINNRLKVQLGYINNLEKENENLREEYHTKFEEIAVMENKYVETVLKLNKDMVFFRKALEKDYKRRLMLCYTKASEEAFAALSDVEKLIILKNNMLEDEIAIQLIGIDSLEYRISKLDHQLHQVDRDVLVFDKISYQTTKKLNSIRLETSEAKSTYYKAQAKLRLILDDIKKLNNDDKQNTMSVKTNLKILQEKIMKYKNLFSKTDSKREKWHLRLREVNNCRKEIQASFHLSENKLNKEVQKIEEKVYNTKSSLSSVSESTDFTHRSISEQKIDQLLKQLKTLGGLDKKKKVMKQYKRLKTNLCKWSNEDIPNFSQNENNHSDNIKQRDRSDSNLSFPETSCENSVIQYNDKDLKMTKDPNDIHRTNCNFGTNSLMIKMKRSHKSDNFQRRTIKMTNLSKYKTYTRPHTPSLR